MIRKLLFLVPLAALGAIWFYFLILPWPVFLRWRDPGSSAIMHLRTDQARRDGSDFELRRSWLPIDSMAPQLVRAVLLAEDGRFYEHDGIDWEALAEEVRYDGDDDFSLLDPSDLASLARAIAYYRANRDEVRGRSTITQQVSKNLYFGLDRSLTRKIDELIVARRLEWFLGKDRILEIYLNIAEGGPGGFGADAAARYYFGRHASGVSRDQAAALAATLPHPLTSNPKTRPAQMQWRKNLILGRMARAGPVRPTGR
jgi:monofunctional biosynthetic peptidoglycan transglycosylase